MEQVKVVRKGTYQGVPQWGISTSSEITPNKKTAEKWAQLENAVRKQPKPYKMTAHEKAICQSLDILCKSV